MKEDICSIPVNEFLNDKDGCPICRMYDTLEESALDFVLGDAMMEPDVRAETNRLGFCSEHFGKMAKRKKRLALALMLESHLDTLDKAVFDKRLFEGGKKYEKIDKLGESCYVCERIESNTEHLLNTFFVLWKKEAEFRESVKAQPTFCLPHYALLLRAAEKRLDKKSYPEFDEIITGITREGLKKLKEDVSGFCKMFDYRSNGTDFGTTKDSIERSINFLTSKKI